MIPQGLVWKFRTWDNELHRRTITNDELYFSSFSDNHKEDPNEGYSIFEQDLTKETLINLLEQGKITAEPPSHISLDGLSPAEIVEKHVKLFDPGFEEYAQQKAFQMDDSRHGILSLTSSIFSKDIWDHHAAGGGGFAVAYDPGHLCNTLDIVGDNVNYETTFSKRPKLKMSEMLCLQNEKEMMKKVMTIKYMWKKNNYQWEKEYRCLMVSETPLSSNQRKRWYPGGIKAIVLGPQIGQWTRQNIMDVVYHRKLECPMFHTEWLNGQLHSRQIELGLTAFV